jgi:hypothetical protein
LLSFLYPLFSWSIYSAYFYPLATNIIKEGKWANRSPCSSPNTSVLITYLGILEHLLTFLTLLTLLFLQELHSYLERGRESAPKMRQVEKDINNILK